MTKTFKIKARVLKYSNVNGKEFMLNTCISKTICLILNLEWKSKKRGSVYFLQFAQFIVVYIVCQRCKKCILNKFTAVTWYIEKNDRERI